MTSIKLFSVPAPGQCIENEDIFLGTVRINMHKASVLAIATSLKRYIDKQGIDACIEVVDMQSDKYCRTEYGIIDFNKLKLRKYRVGGTFESVRDKIKEGDIIGISINYTHSRIIAGDFIEFTKKINSNSIVVVGGTEASAEPLYYLKRGADIVVKGEGERIFEEIVDNHCKRVSIHKIAGTYGIDKGVYYDHTNLNKLIYSIDELSPQDLKMTDFETYTDTGEGTPPSGVNPPFISLETSRGCAEACSFCATPFMKGRYRFMHVHQIVNHLESYWNLGVRTLLFQEDNILSRIHRNQGSSNYVYPDGRKELLQVFSIVKEMGFSWEFSNGLQFGLFESNNNIDYELIEAMFWNEERGGMRRGCYRATIPLENLSDLNFRKFRKLKEFGKAKEIISAISRSNVYMLNFNLIIGRPEDDLEIVKLSFQRCNEVKEIVNINSKTLPFFNVYNLSLLPGTVDYRRYNNLLAFDLEKDPEVVTFYLGSINTPFFNALEITQVRGALAQKLNGSRLISEIDETRFITNQKILSELV